MGTDRTLSLISPLYFTIDRPDSDSFEYEDIPLMEAEPYITEINAAVVKDLQHDGRPADLMPYWRDCPASIREKVSSLTPRVGLVGNTLVGICDVTYTGTLTSKDVAALKEYLVGQYADGFGEGFEQRGIPTEEGLMFAHFWSPRFFDIQVHPAHRDQVRDLPMRATSTRKAAEPQRSQPRIYGVQADAREKECSHDR